MRFSVCKFCYISFSQFNIKQICTLVSSENNLYYDTYLVKDQTKDVTKIAVGLFSGEGSVSYDAIVYYGKSYWLAKSYRTSKANLTCIHTAFFPMV